jgi:signal peptidase I
MKRRWKKLLRDAATLATFVLVILAARSSLADHYHVPSGSMLPTIDLGDRILVNKLAYGFRVPFSNWYLTESAGPRAGDVVICESPEDGEVLIKRVVAVPGDTVEIRFGHVLLNDRAIPIEATGPGLIETLGSAPHPVSLSAGGGPDYGPEKIPSRQYLLVGDNRGNSRDGRMFGLVDRSSILGRAVGIFLGREGFAWRPL